MAAPLPDDVKSHRVTGRMSSPKIGRRHTVYENEYQQVYTVDVDFGEFAKEYFVTDCGQRAGMVVARESSIILVSQYRLLIDRPSWEIPGGRVDDGESPAAAAARECLEETGLRCLSPRPLISYHVGLDTLHNPTHIFYTDEVAEEAEPDSVHAQEVTDWRWVPLPRCIEMISQGRIVDSFSIIALLAYQSLACEQ